MNENYGHADFEELCGLANTGTLSAAEQLKLRRHLIVCPECAEAYEQYRVLTAEAIPWLAATYGQAKQSRDWDQRSARKALFARIRSARQPVTPKVQRQVAAEGVSRWAGLAGSAWMRAAVAACVVASVGYTSYRYGHRQPAVELVSGPSIVSPQLLDEEKSLKAALVGQEQRILLLQAENSNRQAELERLRAAWKGSQKRSDELASTNQRSEGELQSVAAQRSALSVQVAEIQQEYADAQNELARIKDERDKVLLHVASLETGIQDLKAANNEQERRLQDDEQYLAADRDVRELMGARKLYIADVFDVDSGSRTRKPFGRIFYTENKSLIFYAFDLDREPRVKNATFQVWGEKDAAQGEKIRPLNLGILYMDSESNRRWVLHFDDPKQLAEIDAVFVTVEPHGGSPKPTSKPLLYALLRKEANHP
jgi:hypothetical protein